MRTSLRIAITVVMVILASLAGTWVWQHYLYAPWTRDGRIHADIITLSADVAGRVQELAVNNNEPVHQGQTLFQIDDTRYQAALSQARAQVAHEKEQLRLAQHQYQRQKTRRQRSTDNPVELEKARIQAQLAAANLDVAKAEQHSARIDLERTRVKAPADGTVVNVNLQEGSTVKAGKPVLSLVKADSFYVTGYFEETKLPLIKVGQSARITLMHGNHILNGTVTSIGQAIASPAAAKDPRLLPQAQQTFSWVRLAQRIPVRIELEKVPETLTLAAGMTATIRLDDHDS